MKFGEIFIKFFVGVAAGGLGYYIFHRHCVQGSRSYVTAQHLTHDKTNSHSTAIQHPHHATHSRNIAHNHAMHKQHDPARYNRTSGHWGDAHNFHPGIDRPLSQKEIRQWNRTTGHDYMYRDPGQLGGLTNTNMDEVNKLPPSVNKFHKHDKVPDYHSRNPFDDKHPNSGFNFHQHGQDTPFPNSPLQDNVARGSLPSNAPIDPIENPQYST